MSIRRGLAMLLLGAVQARSQTLPPTGYASASPDLPALTAAAQLNLSAGEALLQSGNCFYTLTNSPAAATAAVLSGLTRAPVENLGLNGSLLTSVQGDATADPWPGAALRLMPARLTAPALAAATTDGSFLALTSSSASARYRSPAITDGADPEIPLTISNMSVVFIPNAAPVPEPSVWALTGLGLGLFGWRRRRRQPAGAIKR